MMQKVIVLWSDDDIYIIDTVDFAGKLKAHFGCQQVSINYKLRIVELLFDDGKIQRFSFSDGKII